MGQGFWIYFPKVMIHYAEDFFLKINKALKFEEHPEIVADLGVILDSKEGVKVPSASVGTLWMLRGAQNCGETKAPPLHSSLALYGNRRTSCGSPGKKKLDRICLFGLVGLRVYVCVLNSPRPFTDTHTHKRHPVIKMPGGSMRSVFALDSSSASSSH